MFVLSHEASIRCPFLAQTCTKTNTETYTMYMLIKLSLGVAPTSCLGDGGEA